MTKSNDYGLPSPLTEQAIFDKVAGHLLRQRRAAHCWDDESTCAYRGEGGTACAVGCLIPDNRYSPVMEGFSSGSLFGDEHCKPLDETYHIKELAPFAGLLKRLQRVHDEWTDFDESEVWLKSQLREIVDRLNLSPDVLNFAVEPASSWSPPQAAEIAPPVLPEEITSLLLGARDVVTVEG